VVGQISQFFEGKLAQCGRGMTLVAGKVEVNAMLAALNAPLPTVGSLIDDVEQKGFTFEQGGGWSPTLGAARLAMLPSA
jgi:hypothetical protein